MREGRQRAAAALMPDRAVAVAGAVDAFDARRRRDRPRANFRRMRLTWLSIVRSLTDMRSGYASSIS